MSDLRLWEAWPKGYYAERGVLTIGGWQCAGIAAWGNRKYEAPIWFNVDGVVFDGDLEGEPDGLGHFASHEFKQAVEDGDLLPNVDPNDTATWQCLLKDLALAASAKHNDGKPLIWCGGTNTLHPPRHLLWIREERPEYHPPNERVSWRLLSDKRTIHQHYLNTTDPREALVDARIGLRRLA